MVFNQVVSEIFLCVPSGIPVFDNADSQAMRIYFLSIMPSYLSFSTIVMWLILFSILYALPCARGLILFIVGPLFA